MLKKIFFFVVISLIISCNFHIEKRRYFKGYHVEISKSNYSVKEKEGNHTLSPEDIIVNRKIELGHLAKHTSTIIANNTKSNFNSNTKTNSKYIDNTSKQISSKTQNSGSFRTTKNKSKILLDVNSKKKKNSWDDFYLYGLAGFIGLSIFTFVKKFKIVILKISTWAAKNKKKSQVFIGMIQTTFAVLGVFIGKEFHDLGYDFSSDNSYIFTGLLFIGVILLIRQKISSTKELLKSFFRQKMMHLTIALSSLMLMTVVGNNLGTNNPSKSLAGYLFEKIHIVKLERQKSKVEYSESKTSADKKSRSEKGALVGLYTFLAILMGIVLMGLTCAVWCWAIISAEVGILAIAVVATIAMILLSIFVISAMRRSIDENEASKTL